MNIHDDHSRTTLARERADDLRRSYRSTRRNDVGRLEAAARRLLDISPSSWNLVHRVLDGRRRRPTATS
jgi:hypothetical protein